MAHSAGEALLAGDVPAMVKTVFQDIAKDGDGRISKQVLKRVMDQLLKETESDESAVQYCLKQFECKCLSSGDDTVLLQDFLDFIFENGVEDFTGNRTRSSRPSEWTIRRRSQDPGNDMPHPPARSTGRSPPPSPLPERSTSEEDGKKVNIETLEDLIRELNNKHGPKVKSFWLSRVSAMDEERTPAEAAALEEALRTFDRAIPETGCGIHITNHKFNYMWEQILNAICHNKRFTRWEFQYNDLPDDIGLCLARCLRSAPWADRIALQGNNFRNETLMTITRAAYERDTLRDFRIEKPVGKIPQEVLEAFAALRCKFPACPLSNATKRGRIFESVIAMQSVENVEKIRRTQEEQRQILADLINGEEEKATEVFENVRKNVWMPEHARILQLMTMFIDKSCVIGGFGVMATMPPQKDEYAKEMGENALKQFCPLSWKERDDRDRVRQLLCIAPYKDKVLRNILDALCADINVLALDADQAYMYPYVIDAFLDQHSFLRELKLELPAYKVVVPDTPRVSGSSLSGKYYFYGHNEGHASFVKRNDEGGQLSAWAHVQAFAEKLAAKRSGRNSRMVDTRTPISEDDGTCNFLYLADSRWRLGPKYGSMRCDLKGPVNQEAPDESVVWKTNDDEAHEIRIEPLGANRVNSGDFIRGLLIQLLNLRIDPEYEQLFMLGGSELVKVKYGPPKSLDRALQKEPEWLLDLNRGTLIFDSPTVLVIAFHLLHERVEKLGGRITRYANYFLRDEPIKCPVHALRREQMDKPPCVHLNLCIEGWSYEVLMMLSDFVVAKDTLHKFYELLRAPDLLSGLHPVFDAKGHVFDTKLSWIGEEGVEPSSPVSPRSRGTPSFGPWTSSSP